MTKADVRANMASWASLPDGPAANYHTVCYGGGPSINWPSNMQVTGPRVRECKTIADNYMVIACGSWGEATTARVRLLLALKLALLAVHRLLPYSYLFLYI